MVSGGPPAAGAAAAGAPPLLLVAASSPLPQSISGRPVVSTKAAAAPWRDVPSTTSACTSKGMFQSKGCLRSVFLITLASSILAAPTYAPSQPIFTHRPPSPSNTPFTSLTPAPPQNTTLRAPAAPPPGTSPPAGARAPHGPHPQAPAPPRCRTTRPRGAGGRRRPL